MDHLDRVPVVSHMMQAAHTAVTTGHGDTVVLACLLHNVGYLIRADAGFEDGSDRWMGASFLREAGVREDVCNTVGLHALRKEYILYNASEDDLVNVASVQDCVKRRDRVIHLEPHEVDLSLKYLAGGRRLE